MRIVVGVDGYRHGWVAIRLQDGAFAAAEVGQDLADLGPFLASADKIGIDIPIGLPISGYRSADTLAREFVGPRRSSVFLTMPRDVWMAPDIDEARRLSLALHGRSFSTQAWALGQRVYEVDLAAPADSRIFEVHPEVSFRAMAGESLDYAKSSWAGIELRKSLLRSQGIEIPSSLGTAGAAGVDDVLDAAAAAWSADRVSRRIATSLPDPPERFADGRVAAIWY